VYWYFSPNLTWYWIQTAISQKDPDAFGQYVDIARVRDGIKNRLLQSMSTQFTIWQMAAFRSAIDASMESTLTPESLMKMIETGEYLRDFGGASAANRTEIGTPAEFIMERKGANLVLERSRSETHGQIIAVLERQGFATWKITQLRDDPDKISESPINGGPGANSSSLIGKLAPEFRVDSLEGSGRSVDGKDMLGKVWLLNVWASWAPAGRQEHSLLVRLAKSKVVPIVGLDYKDTRDEGMHWLAQLGDPYVATAFDESGRTSTDYGVFGVPESFLIDKHGYVRFSQVGPLTEETIQNTLIPLIESLNAKP
jgi:cytochrome c biogenesis protein CcmG/thiol:disulfide interchange protein DsbE